MNGKKGCDAIWLITVINPHLTCRNMNSLEERVFVSLPHTEGSWYYAAINLNKRSFVSHREMTCGPSNVEKIALSLLPVCACVPSEVLRKIISFPRLAHVTKGGPMLYNITSRRICITIADGGCKMRVSAAPAWQYAARGDDIALSLLLRARCQNAARRSKC